MRTRTRTPASCASWASSPPTADIIDCSKFVPLEKYLRANFNIHASNKKLVLKLKYFSGDVDDSQPLLHGRVTDKSSMLNWWGQLEAAVGRNLAAAASGSVHAGLFALKKATSVIRPRRAQTEKTAGEHRIFKELVTAIYSEEPGHFADGTWDEKASDICRSNPNILKKFLQMQQLTEVVMGSADYLPNPCVLVCPFDGGKCQHGTFRMNGYCKPSQLYSHWQTVHKDNPAAATMIARWRKALASRKITREALDELFPLEMDGEENEEAVRRPVHGEPHAFPHLFSFNSPEYRAWAVNDGV
jgi:hypothetical protein